MVRLVFAILVSSLFLTSCGVFDKRVKGNGTVKSEDRPAEKFSSVNVSGAIDVYIRQDSLAAIRVETDENLIEYVEITANGDALTIRSRKGFNLKPTKGVKVYLTAPLFRKFTATGASNYFTES